MGRKEKKEQADQKREIIATDLFKTFWTNWKENKEYNKKLYIETGRSREVFFSLIEKEFLKSSKEVLIRLKDGSLTGTKNESETLFRSVLDKVTERIFEIMFKEYV